MRARLGSVGRALPSVEIEVHDPDGLPCPPGVVGRHRRARARRSPASTWRPAAGWTARGWFPTRDRGHIDEDGFLFVEGRSDDTIIRGGENIAPSEIESVLTEHECVADVAVAGMPDDEWGQRIGAFVVVKPGVRPDADVLREFVRGRLRSSKTPDDIVFLPELPTTPTGKVLRRKLVADIGKDAGAPEATRTPVL